MHLHESYHKILWKLTVLENVTIYDLGLKTWLNSAILVSSQIYVCMKNHLNKMTVPEDYSIPQFLAWWLVDSVSVVYTCSSNPDTRLLSLISLVSFKAPTSPNLFSPHLVLMRLKKWCITVVQLIKSGILWIIIKWWRGRREYFEVLN